MLVASLVWGCGAPRGERPLAELAGEARREAPDFTLEALEGGKVRLADLRGKTVVIDFWATWCLPCEFQVPVLNAFWEAHKGDDDVELLGVSVDFGGSDLVAKWVDAKGVRYKVLLGGDEAARSFGAQGFPTLYMVGPDGIVDSEHAGLIEAADLEAALARQRGPGPG